MKRLVTVLILMMSSCGPGPSPVTATAPLVPTDGPTEPQTPTQMAGQASQQPAPETKMVELCRGQYALQVNGQLYGPHGRAFAPITAINCQADAE